MAVIPVGSGELDLLARLMRAEALGEGDEGMLMVGNVGVNRVFATCMEFEDITTITEMVYQDPGGFASTESSLFYEHPREHDLNLAQRVIDGERLDPATHALWFQNPPEGPYTCPPTWYDQYNSGAYKNHCFYIPSEYSCPDVY